MPKKATMPALLPHDKPVTMNLPLGTVNLCPSYEVWGSAGTFLGTVQYRDVDEGMFVACPTGHPTFAAGFENLNDAVGYMLTRLGIDVLPAPPTPVDPVKGAVCPHCKSHMLEAKGCCERTYIVRNGKSAKVYSPLVYGRHAREHAAAQDGDRCHDCGCKPGYLHHVGCDMETCPVCEHQMLSCDCKIKME